MHKEYTRTCPICENPMTRRAKTCRKCANRPRPLVDNGDGTFSVPLTQGYFAIIDASDAGAVGKFNWRVQEDRSGLRYAHRSGKSNEWIGLHRFLMNPAEGFVVDHINGDGLDCRRANMRVTTRHGNLMNRRAASKNRSGYKGVRYRADKRQWVANIGHLGKTYHLGMFQDAESAARAYDVKARELHGAHARLNFPDE